MTLLSLVCLGALIGGLVPLWLAFDFWRDPEGAMKRATHRWQDLPAVMVGRYLAFAALALGAALHGDPRVILYLFTVFSAVSFFDAGIYWRAGHPYGPHLSAGLACWIVIGLAWGAL